MVAAGSVWVFVVGRVVLNWVDGPVKSVTQVLLGVGLCVAAVHSARHPSAGRRTQWALVFLGLLALGEVRMAFLRRDYGVRFEAPTLADVLHPVTTTDLEVRHSSIRLPGIRNERLRVVHLSDLHVTDAIPWDYFAKVEDEIRRLDPDIVMMTGDYVSRADRLSLFSKWLAGLPRPRVGTFATLGNHDYWAGAPEDVRRALRAAGVHVLSGTCEIVTAPHDQRVRICGTEEPWGPRPHLGATGSDKLPTIVLSHSPDNVYSLKDAGADVVFAGHTHGGQLRIPGFGAVVIPSSFGRRFDLGHFTIGATHLFVTAGVGADAPALRLWCPPELDLVDFEAAASS